MYSVSYTHLDVYKRQVSHKTVDEMAAMYGLNQEQKEYLAELLKGENNQLWSQVLYGI